MVSEAQITEILSLYTKHGWTLSRVLLSEELEKKLSEHLERIFGTVEIAPSEVDAAWFSRPSKNNSEAWELRHLAAAPYALFEVFDAETDEDSRDEKLFEMENQLTDKFSPSKT